MAIGVFDSGLGGLTVLSALARALPNQPFVYLGDNANAPYGARPPDQVVDLTQAACARLFDEGCPLVLVACNTASALGLRRLQQDWLPGLPDAEARRLLGVFVPIVEVVTGRRWIEAHPPSPAPGGRRRLWVFATPATVASGAFEREVAARATGLRVVSIPCAGLVDALEAGDDRAAAESVRAAVADAARRDAEPGAPEAAILGCTHYPLALTAFRAALPPETAILSQPDITAASLARYLERRPQFESAWRPGAAPRLRCLTSGDPEAVGGLAARFFGEPLRFEPL